MDFHSLSRRVLQLLCKHNKLPANTTNIAMADALQSLPTVEGLDQIQQEGITPTRPPNPPRSCRKSSSLISKTSSNSNTRVEQEQPKIKAAPSGRTSKRSRTLSPSSRQRDHREDPIKVMPLAVLVPCKESAAYLKTYNRRERRDDSSEKQESASDCTQGVLQNADSIMECTRVGGKGEAFDAEAVTGGQEPVKRTRSIGVQVDIVDIDSQLPDISVAHRDNTREIPDDEQAEASCLEHHQCAFFFPEPSQESLNFESTIINLSESQQPQSPEIEEPNANSQESDASIGCLPLVCVPVVEENEGKEHETIGIHNKEEENEEGISKSGEMSIETLELKQQIEEETELASLSLRKLRSLYKQSTKEVIKSKEESGGDRLKVQSEEKKKAEDARLNGLSLRQLKFLYKHKVFDNQNLDSPQ